MRHVLIPLLATLFFLLAQGAGAEILTGRVVAVSDGDTLTVLDKDEQQYRIRLYGIDAPEKVQPYG